jgi:hypothetical protein
MRRRLFAWVPPAQREASSKMEMDHKVNHGAMTPSTRAPSTPGSLAPPTPSRYHELSFRHDLPTHLEEQRHTRSSLHEHSISAPCELPFRSVACACETPHGHAAATKLQAWRRGMMARRMYLTNLPAERRIGLYVYERCDQKGLVTRPKLHLLRQLLTHLGCDTSGWHTFAGWRHRDPRKETLMRQGRHQELSGTTLGEGARRLRRRILLGNIVLPAAGLDHTAFRAILCHTLGHTVEIVRSWTERGNGKNLKQKKLINVQTHSLEPSRSQKTPIHYDGELPETFDVNFIVRVGQALERGEDPFAALPPAPGLPAPQAATSRRWADHQLAFDEQLRPPVWPAVSSKPPERRIENPPPPVVPLPVHHKISSENPRKICQNGELSRLEHNAAMKIQAWRRGVMTRRAQLANLDIDPGRRIGLYVYERVNEEGQVVRLRLPVLRRELEAIGADLSGWHVCAGWRHRDPRREAMLREGRWEELKARGEAQRRLSRRILLGNIILPQDTGPHISAFKMLLSQTLNFPVEIVRNWAPRDKIKSKKNLENLDVTPGSPVGPPPDFPPPAFPAWMPMWWGAPVEPPAGMTPVPHF